MSSQTLKGSKMGNPSDKIQEIKNQSMKEQIDQFKQQGEELQRAANVARHEVATLKHQRTYFLDQVTNMTIENRLLVEERDALTGQISELYEQLAELKAQLSESKSETNEAKSVVGTYKRKFGTVMDYLHMLGEDLEKADFGMVLILTEFNAISTYVNNRELYQADDSEEDVADEVLDDSNDTVELDLGDVNLDSLLKVTPDVDNEPVIGDDFPSMEPVDVPIITNEIQAGSNN